MGLRFDGTRIILETREQKPCFSISEAEFLFVVKEEMLTSTDKVVWLMIAYLTSFHSDLSCIITHPQLLAEMLALDEDVLQRSLKRLIYNGFIHTRREQVTFYTLSLPQEGLLALEWAAVE